MREQGIMGEFKMDLKGNMQGGYELDSSG